MQEPFHGVPRGRKRDAYDNWVQEQEQLARHPRDRHHGFGTRAEVPTDGDGDAAGELRPVKIHDGDDGAVEALTDEVHATQPPPAGATPQAV